VGLSILLGLVVILGTVGVFLYFITIYNSLVRLRNANAKAWANIDVLLKQRYDELPKLIETCKGYMQYEQKAFQLIAEARAAFTKATTVSEKAQADNLVRGALKALLAVAENYPDLKANASFRQLRGRITELETKIAGQRSTFNEDVNIFNIRIAQIPANLVAGFMHLQPHALFQAAESDREEVQIKFT